VRECDSDVSSDESFSVSEGSDIVMTIRNKSLLPLLSCALGWTGQT
jgi:hypothetical protein